MPVELADVIRQALEEYGEEVHEAVNEAGRLTAKEVAKAIKGSNPGFNNHKYLQGWTQKETAKSELKVEYTVYNRNRYQVAHLLEYGHAKKGGGRTRAFPHIAPIADKAGEIMEKHLGEILG